MSDPANKPPMLADFEGSDDADQELSSGYDDLIKPRTRPHTPASLPRAGRTPQAAAGKTTTGERSTVDSPDEQPAARRGRPPKAPAATKDVVKPSTIQIPVDFLALVKERREAEHLSTGDIIIAAIEATHADLPALLNSKQPASGGLFAPRTTKSQRGADGPLGSLNVRLRVQDWEVIDHLVDEHQAFSRGHLITTALKAYLA